jgi:hypothetical protein
MEANGRAGIWTSLDGSAWTGASTPKPPPNRGNLVVDVVRATACGQWLFVAVAHATQRDVDDVWLQTTARPSLILVSEDARTWRVAADTPMTQAEMNGLAVAPAGFVAAGSRLSGPSTEGPRQDGVVWRSRDGDVWTETAPDSMRLSVPLGVETLADRFVATGFKDEVGAPKEAWISSDGLSWTAIEVRAAENEGSVYSVARASGGLIALIGLGHDGTFGTLSSDGRTWSTEPLPTHWADPTGVTISDGSIVAVGYTQPGDGIPDVYLWVRDARNATWRSVQWRSHVPDELEDRIAASAFLDVATDGQGAGILQSDGTVIFTDQLFP